jgi:hypothetical protein
LALIYEYSDNYADALKIWSFVKSAEGCDRTISILKRLGKKDLITTYAKWVLEAKPQIGLTLFEDSTKKDSPF